MKSRKRLLSGSRLYVILDKRTAGKRSVFDIAGRLKNSGADIIQLRDKESEKSAILKEASSLRKVLSGTKALFIINDYLDVAKIIDSDGIHLGQFDTSIETARKVLGRAKIIGVSCHNFRQAVDAQNRGADYIGIGPLFATATKPEYKPIGLEIIRQLKEKLKIPFFAIGDINQNNISKVMSAGAKRVAICRAILEAKDTVLAARAFSNRLR